MIEKKKLVFEKTVLIGVITARQDEEQALEYLAELAFLAHTAGGEVIKQYTQKMTLPNPKTFIGSGKLQEIQQFVKENEVSTLVFDDELTPAQQREMQRNINRGTTLGGIQSVADARIAQRDANQKLLADLINIGQGVNRTSLQQLGSAAADATQRKNAYTQARASYKANKYSTIGGLGAMAIMALPFL